MTSTVLDVTVMLLCVSASVIALSAGGLPHGGGEATASEIADRLATETVTVTYTDPSAPDGNRTVHATRAELLGLLVGGDVDTADGSATTAGGSSNTAGDGTAASDAFEQQALAVIAAGLHDRTRIDARIHPAGSIEQNVCPVTTIRQRSTRSAETTDPKTTSATGFATAVGRSPPRSADTTVAVSTHPVPDTAAPSDSHVRIVVRRW